MRKAASDTAEIGAETGSSSTIRWPANQLQMMKMLVNQAYEQMGLKVTQMIGTLLDGAARHTPEGTDFTRTAIEDVGRAVAERDEPFGDYGFEQRG